MKITPVKTAIALLGLALACAPLQPSLAQQKLLFVQDSPINSVKDNSFKLFVQIVEKKLPGKFAITLSEGGQLYNQNSELAAVQLGAAQMIAPGTGTYANTFPKVNALTLPYLLPSPQAFQAAVDDPKIGGVIFADMRAKNVEPLAVWLNGPRDVGRTGDKPILWPEDMKGVKIRVPPGDVYVEAFKRLGANVTTMSFEQVPTALRQGVLDAVEPTPNNWVSAGLYEIAKQVTLNGYIWDTYIVTANKPWWDGLAPDVRQVMKDAMAEATKWNWEHVNADNDHALDVMRKAGTKIYTLTAEQTAAWKKSMRPLWNDMGDKLVGAETVKQLIAIGEKYP